MELQKLLIKNDKSPKFYQYYPRLFENYFEKIDNEAITSLSEAGYLYYQSVLRIDALIDDNDISDFWQILTLQEEAIKILASIYKHDSTFWEYWDKRKNEYFSAVKIEKHLDYERDVLFSIYEDLADKKSAFGKIAIDCLYLLSKNKTNSIYRKLLKSHKFFSVGFQLYDDVKDFKEDFEKGQFNWAVYELKKNIDFQKFNNSSTTLNKLLFIREVGQNVLKDSISYFNKALNILKNLDTKSEWVNVVTEMHQTITGYLDITYGYIKTIEKKIELKNKQVNLQFFKYSTVKNRIIRKGLDYIKFDFEQNYANLKHIMYLSELDGFENNHKVHVSDTFQRALLNDCLISVSKKYKLDISEFLNNECNYLIECRNLDDIGGWSYFSTVNEIAADIDDLGQIMQLFIYTRNELLVDKYCKKSIETSLSERTCLNGGIETWIIPQKSKTKIQEKQEYFNEIKWGKGPDLEVVANFVYALYLFNKDLYTSQIEESLKFIIKQRKETYFWESRWYYGRYYGTYICLRLMKYFKERFSKQIKQTVKAIIQSQNKDGGFSLLINSNSDPLSTSFAILCLRLFLSNSDDAIIKAISYLKMVQSVDGSWEAVDFIKPKINEPYKSKTISTVFVLKALCYQ